MMLAQSGYVETGTSAIGLQLLIVAVTALTFGLFIFALVDAIRRPASAWRAAGSSKPLWIFLILILQFFGALAYLAGVRPRLRQAGEP